LILQLLHKRNIALMINWTTERRISTPETSFDRTERDVNKDKIYSDQNRPDYTSMRRSSQSSPELNRKPESFDAYCAVHGLKPGPISEAVKVGAEDGRPALGLEATRTAFGLGKDVIVKATAQRLLLGVDYMVCAGEPVFTLEGLGKLAENFALSAVSKELSKCLLLYSRYTSERLRTVEQVVVEERERAKSLQEKLTGKYQPAERVYVMKNSVYGPEHLYKVGRTKNLEKRLSTYNTGNPSGAVTIVYEKKCCDGKVIEGMVHHILDSFRFEDNREYFHCDVRKIKEVIDHCVESCDGYRERLRVADAGEGKEPVPLQVNRRVPDKEEIVRSPYFQRWQPTPLSRPF
jgi:Meiotically Up-regulated Gene 113 (MUG113) protein